MDHLGDDLEAILARGQDRFRPPHERWRWAYERPWIMRTPNRPLWALVVPIAAVIAVGLIAKEVFH